MNDFLIDDKRWNAVIKRHGALFKRLLKKTLVMSGAPAAHYIVSILMTDDKAIRALNKEWRKKDKATNVLSFPQYAALRDIKKAAKSEKHLLLGDIALAFDTVKAEAKTEKKALRDHTAHLLVHGLLHLIGYDHLTDKDAAKMERLEIAVLKTAKIPDPY